MGSVAMPSSVRDAVEATLVGRDIRLVQRCDVDRIVAALEGYGCYDVPMLTDTLESSFGSPSCVRAPQGARPGCQMDAIDSV